MKKFLFPLIVVLLGLGGSLASYMLGRRAATSAIQVGLAEITAAAQKAAHEGEAEEEILPDPPESVPADAEQQAESSLVSLEAMRETAEPGSLRFDNPDVVNLLVQFRRRIEYVEDRERRLRELEERLKLEMQNLNVATQWIARTRLSQDLLLAQRMKFIDEEEQGRLQEHARRMVALPPAQAVAILTNFPPAEIAKTLMVVGSTNSASLLGALAMMGPDGPRNAAEISKLMLRMTTKPSDRQTNNAAPPAK